VTDPAAVEQAMKHVEHELGPIERVYNATAIMPTGLPLDHELAAVHRIMDINYGGTVNGA